MARCRGVLLTIRLRYPANQIMHTETPSCEERKGQFCRLDTRVSLLESSVPKDLDGLRKQTDSHEEKLSKLGNALGEHKEHHMKVVDPAVESAEEKLNKLNNAFGEHKEHHMKVLDPAVESVIQEKKVKAETIIGAKRHFYNASVTKLLWFAVPLLLFLVALGTVDEVRSILDNKPIQESSEFQTMKKFKLLRDLNE